MKECFTWIALYGVYWYISAIIGNMLYNLTKIHWINDVTRMFLPFIFLSITYLVLKYKNKKENAKVKISENKIIVNSLKIIGIVLGVLYLAVILIFLMYYVQILLK